MPRVVVVNNYSLDRVWQEVKNGQTPDQYLYGINYFAERGYEVEIAPLTDTTIYSKIQRLYERLRGPVPLGNLEQQLLTWDMSKKADLIYAPCQTQTYLLAYLRFLNCFKIPIVCLAHQPINPGRLSSIRKPFMQMMIDGIDAYPSLSRRVSEQINSYAQKSQPVIWGPDRKFFQSRSSRTNSPGKGIVAAGRTGRDFRTLAKAASVAGVDTHIVCLRSSYDESLAQLSGNVKITVRPDDQFMPYAELMEIYSQARALAIPLYSANHLNGLSSLVDALAMGKPVIMTRNPYIDIDIEQLGIGKWVEPNDQNGWVVAMQYFEKNPDAALEMGRRALALVDGEVNSYGFAHKIMDIFDLVLDK